MKIYLKLQTPTIELPIVTKDSTKAKDNCLVGFKRYEIKDSQKKMTAFQEVFKEYREAQEKDADNPFVETRFSDKLNEIISGEIVYIKNMSLQVEDDAGKVSEFKISDTRTAKPLEGAWNSPEECLSFCIELFLNSAPYRSAVMNQLMKALSNMDFDEAETKN